MTDQTDHTYVRDFHGKKAHTTDRTAFTCPHCGCRFVHSHDTHEGAFRDMWLAVKDGEISSAVKVSGPESSNSAVATLRVLKPGKCRSAIQAILLAAIRACRRDGFLKLVVQDSATREILCDLQPCGLHAPQVRRRNGRQLCEFYLDLYWRGPSDVSGQPIPHFVEPA